MKAALTSLNATMQKTESRIDEIEKLLPQLTTQSTNFTSTIVSTNTFSTTTSIATTSVASNSTTTVSSTETSPTTTQNSG